MVKEEPVVEAKPVVEETPKEEPSLTVYDFKGLQERLKATLQMVRELSTEVNRMEKEVNRERRTIERDPYSTSSCGQEHPEWTSLSLDVFPQNSRKFLGIGKDDLIARTDVTKGITKYCQEHSLHKPEDKRVILPDAKLRKLLRVDKGQELTYFNLQTYMKVHFPNKEGVFPGGISA